MHEGKQLMELIRASDAALPWSRRFPWWVLLGIPLAIANWALQLMPLWQLLRWALGLG